MRSLGAEGIAEKTRRSSGQTAFYERFNEERSMDIPLLVLRRRAPRLSPAPPTTRGPAGASRSPDGALRYERQSPPLGKGQSPAENRSEGLRRPPPSCTWSPSRRGVAQVTPARPAARSSS